MIFGDAVMTKLYDFLHICIYNQVSLNGHKLLPDAMIKYLIPIAETSWKAAVGGLIFWNSQL